MAPSSSGARVELDVALECADRALPSAAAFERWVGAALAAAPEAHAGRRQVDVRIVGTEESRALNGRWRGRDAPTNVLAFPADLPPAVDVPLLGDLVICADVVAREAREQGKAAEAHWAHLTVHGTLHLLGFDHRDDAEAAVMEGEERRLLAELGYPDPYAARG